GQPRLLNLKDLIDAFISHRREVVTRRTVFELRKARERGHLLEGLAVALSNVDEVVDLIKRSPNPAEAKRGLMARPWPSQLVRDTKIISDELGALKENFADKRKSEIVTVAEDISIEDLIAPQDMVVTFSHGGYVKSQPLTEYKAQRRGGRGRMATTMKEDDFIERLFVAHSHDYLLCFSNRGKLYWLKVFEVPAGSRSSRGKPVVNMFPLEEGEKITA